MAPFECDPDVEAKMDQIDVLLARNRAIVASWGYEVKVPTKEDIEAEYKLLRQVGPPGLGLGYPIPQEWIDGEEERNAVEERKWRTGSLRKNMGLQASKPRNPVEKSMDTAANNEAESSDEEEGRSGLGKAKHGKHASTRRDDTGEISNKEEVDLTFLEEPLEFEESFLMDEHKPGSLRETKANLDKVEAWNEDTARALSETPFDPSYTSTWESLDQDFVEASAVKDTVSQESILRSSVRALFEKQQNAKNTKKRKYADSNDTKIDTKNSTEKPVKLPKIAEVNELVVTSRSKRKSNAKRLSFSAPKRKRGESPTPDGSTSTPINRETRTEDGVKMGSQIQDDMDALARARQLARERLGSGSTSKNTKRKVKSSNPVVVANLKKLGKKPR